MDDAVKWLEEFIARDVVRLRKLLSTILAASGLTRQDVDKRIGRRPGYTSNVLTGRVELKAEHAVAILLICGIHPGHFYEMLYPKDRPFGPVKPSPTFPQLLALAGVSVEELDQTPEPPLPPPPATKEELHKLIEEAVGRALAAHEAAQRKKKRKGKARRPTRKPRSG